MGPPDPIAPLREGRLRRIREAAYFKAEKRGFAPGKELDDWLEAEADTVGAAIEAFDLEAAFEHANDMVESADGALGHQLNTRGFLHLQLGRYAEAVADCTEARRINPDLDQSNLMHARLFNEYRDQVIVRGIERLRHGLSAEACADIAIAYFATGFYANAASYLNLAISVAAPEQLAQLYNALAGAYHGAGMPIEAYQASAKALALNPQIDTTNHVLASLEIRALGQDPRAFLADPALVPQQQLSVQGALDPDYGASLERLNPRIEETQAAAQGSDAARVELVSLLQQRCRCRLNLRDFDAAIADARAARQLDPHLGHADLRLAQFFQVQFDAALKPLFARLEHEISAETYIEIGVVFFRDGFHNNAATYFQLAAAISEGLVQAEALNNLAGAYYESRFLVEALRASTQAIAMNPSISKVNHHLTTMALKPMGLDVEALLRDPFASRNKAH